LFRKTASDSPEPADSAATEAEKAHGKGRPTPTRKEAETARKERLKAGVDRKSATKADRARRAEVRRKALAGMKAGDEKYLMPRDQGPVRRYIRDWIDSRFTFIEFVLPLLLLILLLQVTGNKTLIAIGSYLWATSILLLVLDLLWTNFRLKRELRKRFPDESLRGTTFYALMRAMQLRFMRMPKPRVKLGQKIH
jgi:Protein of unknown function (DUF3043)